MEKRGKQRLGVCAALVLLILGGFMDNNVKTELKRSVGAQFCYFLAVEKKVEWPMEVLAVYPVKNRNVTAKIEYDPEQLQKENEELLQEENDSQETLALQQDTAVQSENVAAVPASGVTSNTGEEAFVKKIMGDERCPLSLGSFLHSRFYNIGKAKTFSGRTSSEKRYEASGSKREKADFDLSYSWGIGKFFGQPFRESGRRCNRSRREISKGIGKKWIRSDS